MFCDVVFSYYQKDTDFIKKATKATSIKKYHGTHKIDSDNERYKKLLVAF